tara:strand:+ start:2604 stop:2945 length:342 start_codon:yes stop_codon:yes gene_type:complete
MTEMEQEKRSSLHADVMLRRALDLRAKNNVLIAEFMGGQKVLSDKDIYNMPTHDNLCYQLKELQYHQSWDWLMPVIDKCYQEHMSKHIADAVMTCDKDKAYQAVVEFIKQLNK